MNEEIKKLICDKFEEKGYIKYNNMHILELDQDYAKVEAILDENSMNPNGIAHGGFIFGLADTTMGVASSTVGRNVCTVNSQIDYLRPGKGTKLIAEAEKIKVGKTIAVYKCNIYDDQEKLIATATATYFFID